MVVNSHVICNNVAILWPYTQMMMRCVSGPLVHYRLWATVLPASITTYNMALYSKLLYCVFVLANITRTNTHTHPPACHRPDKQANNLKGRRVLLLYWAPGRDTREKRLELQNTILFDFCFSSLNWDSSLSLPPPKVHQILTPCDTGKNNRNLVLVPGTRQED